MTREEECDGSLTLTLIADLWADVTKPNPNINRNPCARLADLWTDVIDAEEYARFLLDLLAKMQAVREGEGEGEASGWVPYAKMEPISEAEAEAEAEAWVRCLRVKPSHPRTLALSLSHALTLSRSHALTLSLSHPHSHPHPGRLGKWTLVCEAITPLDARWQRRPPRREGVVRGRSAVVGRRCPRSPRAGFVRGRLLGVAGLRAGDARGGTEWARSDLGRWCLSRPSRAQPSPAQPSRVHSNRGHSSFVRSSPALKFRRVRPHARGDRRAAGEGRM